MTSSEADERLRCAENMKYEVQIETVFRYIKQKIQTVKNIALASFRIMEIASVFSKI